MRKLGPLLLFSGCASGAHTWPEVVDNHVIIASITICWIALCVVWLIRGFSVSLSNKEDE